MENIILNWNQYFNGFTKKEIYEAKEARKIVWEGLEKIRIQKVIQAREQQVNEEAAVHNAAAYRGQHKFASTTYLVE